MNSQSMKPVLFSTKGFSLVELLLGVSLFSVAAAALGGALLYGQEGQRLAGERARAVYLAEEGLEAARNIRDDDFAALSAGTHGLSVTSGQWELSGVSDTTGIFTRQLVISDIDADRKQVTSTVQWDQNPQRPGEVQLVTYLTNWPGDGGGGGGGQTCAQYCQGLQGYSTGSCQASENQCSASGGTHEPDGDQYCPGTAGSDTCCCSP